MQQRDAVVESQAKLPFVPVSTPCTRGTVEALHKSAYQRSKTYSAFTCLRQCDKASTFVTYNRRIEWKYQLNKYFFQYNLDCLYKVLYN